MRADFSFLLTLLFAVVLLEPASSQAPAPSQPTAAPAAETLQLSPQAAYVQALHPLEVTRHNIANWSEIEIAAMTVAVAQARDACVARKPDTYTGADLVDLARLCSLGQQWSAVVEAASRYLALPAEPKPLRAEAYIAQTEAYLRLHQEPAAVRSALTMLAAVPYTPEVGDCIDEALQYLQFVHTADALALAEARQPRLLAALRTNASPGGVAANQSTPAAAVASSAVSVSALYAQGLQLPALQQMAAREGEARSSLLALDAAVPGRLSPDNALLVGQMRRRYALLGQPLTGLAPSRSLSMPTDKPPVLPVRGAITAMLLFPDWCAPCLRLGPQLPPTVFTVEGHSAYLYALLAPTVPPLQPDPKRANTAFAPAYAAAALSETPTVVVAPQLLERFGSGEFPVLLIADTRGVLRVLQPTTVQNLQPGNDIDAAIALVGRNFGARISATPATPAPKTP